MNKFNITKILFVKLSVKNNLKNKIFCLINAILVSTLTAFAHGPESGGGGGVVFENQKPKLIDYFLIPNGPSILNVKYDLQANSSYNNNFEISIKSDTDFNIKDPAFLLAKNKFTAWSELPFDIIASYVSSALYSPIIWNFQNKSAITYEHHFRSKYLSPDIPIVTAAYYSKKSRSYNVFIDNSIWNQLPLSHQSGLLIHEALRHIQLANMFYFDDESLQKATAIIMICNPSIKLNQYINYLLQNKKVLAEKNIGLFDEVTHECWK